MKKPSIGLFAVLAVAWLGAGEALAAGKRIGVPKFEGPQEALTRKRVMQVLKSQGYELVKSREIEGTGISLDSNEAYKALAKELALSGIVTGELSPKKARIAVRDGSDGSVSGEGSFAGANPRKVAAEVGKSFWRRLGSAVDRGKVPAGAKKPQASAVAESPEDKEDAPDAAGGDDDSSDDKAKERDKESASTASKSESDDSGSGGDDDKPRKRRNKKAAAEVVEEQSTPSTPSNLPWLDAGAGGRGFTRSLLYHQDVNASLRQYKLDMGPAAVADILFYPFALFDNGPVSNIGVQLGVEQAFGVTSRVGMSTAFPDGATFPTIIHDFSGAVHYRIPVSEHELGVSVGGGEHAFAFRSNGPADRTRLDLPDTIYHYVRAGVSGRFAIASGISVFGGGGYRYIANKGGQIHDKFFPNSTVQGVDATLGVAYKVTPIIEARLAADVRRYFYDMHSVAADALKAGGAVDQYISVTGMLAFMLGGEGGGSSGEAEPPPDMGKEKHRRSEGGGSGDE